MVRISPIRINLDGIDPTRISRDRINPIRIILHKVSHPRTNMDKARLGKVPGKVRFLEAMLTR